MSDSAVNQGGRRTKPRSRRGTAHRSQEVRGGELLAWLSPYCGKAKAKTTIYIQLHTLKKGRLMSLILICGVETDRQDRRRESWNVVCRVCSLAVLSHHS